VRNGHNGPKEVIFPNVQNLHRVIAISIKEVRKPYVGIMVMGEKVVAVAWTKVRPGK
jgi:hypothetical protein